jgi:Flp pilus assembly protein TadB
VSGFPKSATERLVTLTVTLIVVVIGLTWVWHRLRPLLPFLIIIAVLVIVLKVVQYRRDHW